MWKLYPPASVSLLLHRARRINWIEATAMKRLFWITFVALLLTAIWGDIAAAQQPQPQPTPSDDKVNAIAKQLYCPVCENTPLDVCPTQACAQWRALIRQQLAQGMTEAQIKQYFVDQYGARVLAEPPATGLNWLVYIAPPVGILIGIYILYRALTSMRTASIAAAASAPVEPESPTALADDYVARLEEELKKRK
jgi:cytochrome c-type biogenesis protein CcmH